MTLRPPSADVELPQLVRKSQRALVQEARSLRGALDEYVKGTPMTGCPYETDTFSAKRAGSRVRSAQRQLLAAGEHQARLFMVNAYDHLVSMSRLLGSDGAMSLYAHTTLSRSVCEAAVRHSWILGASLSYEERIARSAAGLIANTENRLKGAREAPEINMGADIKQKMVAHCTTEDSQVRKLIGRAGMDLVPAAGGRRTARVELRGTTVKASVKVDIGPLMENLLPESPGWYLLSSGIAHSATWVLHTAMAGPANTSEFALTPDLMELAAAAETAISATALIIRTHATYYGYDPEPQLRKSRQRRDMLDVLMRDQAVRQMTNPAPLVPADYQ